MANEKRNLDVAKSLKSLGWSDDEIVRGVKKMANNPEKITVVMPAHYEDEAKAHAENTCKFVHGVSKGDKRYEKLYKQAFNQYLTDAYANSTGVDMDEVKKKRRNPTPNEGIEKTPEGFVVRFNRGKISDERKFGVLGGAEAKKFYDKMKAKKNPVENKSDWRMLSKYYSIKNSKDLPKIKDGDWRNIYTNTPAVLWYYQNSGVPFSTHSKALSKHPLSPSDCGRILSAYERLRNERDKALLRDIVINKPSLVMGVVDQILGKKNPVASSGKKRKAHGKNTKLEIIPHPEEVLELSPEQAQFVREKFAQINSKEAKEQKELKFDVKKLWREGKSPKEIEKILGVKLDLSNSSLGELHSDILTGHFGVCKKSNPRKKKAGK